MTRDHAAALHFTKNEIAIAKDRGEKVVEIVGGTAGQLAERFHFLRATKLILQLFALGDIHQDTGYGLRSSAVISQDRRSFQKMNVTAVRMKKPIFAGPTLVAAGDRLINIGRDPRIIFGMDVLAPKRSRV